MTTPGETLRALHEDNGAFVIPNPWDAGSARILAGMGFKALATTSGGMAYALGKRDGAVSRDEALNHCRDIVAATSLPVSADLEKGFGDTPEEMFDIITAAAETGLAGCSIEDYTGDPDAPIYDEVFAKERVVAASEACKSLASDFVLTARCESLVWTDADLNNVIRRLQVYETAGADVLFAPGLDDFESIRTVVSAVNAPVNVIMSTPGLPFGVKELSEIGVKRISIGSAFAQLAYGSLIAAADEIVDKGTFSFAKTVIDYEKLEAFFPHHQSFG